MSAANLALVRSTRPDDADAFAVGIIVIITGGRVLRDASLELADTTPASELIDAARTISVAVPGVAGVEKLFARKTGLQYHLDVHIEVSPEMTVMASHEIAVRVRATLQRERSWVADALVHVDPARGL